MRLIFFLLIATLGLYSCNNDLTTIGQDLINNGNHIEVQTTLLKETGTIKIDSFITSSGRYGSAITEMFMGRYKDQWCHDGIPLFSDRSGFPTVYQFPVFAGFGHLPFQSREKYLGRYDRNSYSSNTFTLSFGPLAGIQDRPKRLLL